MIDFNSSSQNSISFSEEVIEAISRIIAERTGGEITDFFRLAGYPNIIHDGSTKFRFVSEQLRNFYRKKKGSEDIKNIVEKLVQPKQYIGLEEYHKNVTKRIKNALSYDNLTINENYKVIPKSEKKDDCKIKKDEIIDSIASRLGRITGDKSIEKIFPHFFEKNYFLLDKSKTEKIAVILSKTKDIDDFKMKLQPMIDYHQSYFTKERQLEFNDILKSVSLKLNDKLMIEKIDMIDTIETIQKDLNNRSLKIISEILPKDLIQKGKEMAEVYTLIYCIENSLRLFVDNIFREKYGIDYMEKIEINNDIKKKIKKRKFQESKNLWLPFRGDNDLFYMDFYELGLLIQNNWEQFKNIFPSQSWILVKLKEIVTIRNYIAHNSYFEKDEKNILKLYYTQILKQIGSIER